MVEIGRYCEEFLRVRPYFAEDMYPLTIPSDATDVWSAVQFDRPSEKDGILQVFRREHAPYETANYTLGGIAQDDTYTFIDADTGEGVTISGKELAEKGLTISIKEKRCAKLYLYKHET